MLKLRCLKQLAPSIQVLEYLRVCLLDKQTCKRSLLRQLAFSVDKLYERKIVIASHVGIVLTKRRCNVHDTGTIGHSYIAVAGHEKALLSLLVSDFLSTVKQWLVLLVLQIFSLVGFQHFKSFDARFVIAKSAQHLLGKCLRKVIGITICRFYLDIGIIRVHTKCYVARKCPRGRCPCQEVCILAYHLKADNCRALLYRLIALCHLLCRKRCTAARAIRNNFKALVQ